MQAATNRARAQILKEKLHQQQEIINNAMMTEQQKNAKLVEEVVTSKEYESEQRVKQVEREVLSEIKGKCPIHAKNIF